MKQVLIIGAFFLGVVFYGIGHYFLGSECHRFPMYGEKHHLEAILTPQQHLQYSKQAGKFPTVVEAPKTLILCYDDGLLKDVLQKKSTLSYDIPVYFFADYPSVAIAKFGIFGPTNVMYLERMVAWGVKRIIAIGTSCALQENLTLGDVIVCEKSVRDEGTSHHYLPYSKYAYPSKKLQERLLNTLKQMDRPYVLGPSWTTDAFYRATIKEVKHYQKEGVLCIEGEAASLFAFAAFRNIDAVAMFTVTDSYAKLRWEKPISSFTERKLKALNVLLEIALKVASSSCFD